MEKKLRNCLICGTQLTKLGSHVRKIHRMDFQQYLIMHKHDGVRPTCECGCGSQTPYTTSSGFAPYMKGHRPKRTHTDESKAKIAETRRRYYDDHPDARQRVGENFKRWRGNNPDAYDDVRRKIGQKIVGKKRSAETRQKMSDSINRFWAENPDARQRASEMRTKFWAENPDVLKRMIETKRSRMDIYRSCDGYGSQRWRSAIGASISELISAGNYWSNGTYVSSRDGSEHRYQSSFELVRMRMLDADESVISWTSSPVRLAYEMPDGRHLYTPDLLIERIDGTKTIEEIGPPQVKETTEQNIAKREALRAFCESNGYQMSWAWAPSV